MTRLLAVLFLMTLRVWADDPQITIRPFSALTEKADVTLADIAETRNLPAIYVDKLARTKLADTPMPGERRQFSQAAIAGALHEALGGMSPAPQMKIPGQVVVERPPQIVLRSNVEQKLQAAWKLRCEDCEFRILQLSVPKILLKNGDRWSLQTKSDFPRGSFSTAVDVVSANEEHRTFWVQGQVAIYREVPVAKRSMNIGERLQQGDFELQMRDVTFATDGVPTSPEMLGRRLRLGLRANDAIFVGHIERDKAMRRGEVVRIQAREEGFEVIMSGLAEQDGFIGDTVNVRNPKTNRILSGTVTAQGEVEVR